jgi:hypothetical protein
MTVACFKMIHFSPGVSTSGGCHGSLVGRLNFFHVSAAFPSKAVIGEKRRQLATAKVGRRRRRQWLLWDRGDCGVGYDVLVTPVKDLRPVFRVSDRWVMFETMDSSATILLSFSRK